MNKATIRFTIDDIIFEVEYKSRVDYVIRYFSEKLARWIDWPGSFSTRQDNFNEDIREMIPIIKGQTYLLGWVTSGKIITKGSNDGKGKTTLEYGAYKPRKGSAAERDRRRADADLRVASGAKVGSAGADGEDAESESADREAGSDRRRGA